MKRTKIAIACQGGGSHTAFTAGVLKKLFEEKVHETHEIVGLSGTSGGAICALLGWQYLRLEPKNDLDAMDRCLIGLWRDNTAQYLCEILWDQCAVAKTRLEVAGIVPDFNLSPYSTPIVPMLEIAQVLAPRQEFLDLENLLTKHVRFADLQKRLKTPYPRLLLGAVDVISGKFKAFDSWKREITVEATLASAAIPTLFPAASVNGDSYWDGLFSENPPITPFLSKTPFEHKPQEIWIIQINPERREDVPDSMPEILDRRNELAGNLSLRHEVENIHRINRWIKEKRLSNGGGKNGGKKKQYQRVTLRRITMEPSLATKLDYASKLDRSSQHINGLIAAGEKRAESFLEDPAGHEIPCNYEDAPDIDPI